jgi:transposase
MGHIHGANRHEVIVFPERLDDDMAEDKPVRFLEAFVDALDLAGCGFQRAAPATTGRPGYAPGALLQLYLDGYLYRLRASRRLEQETHHKIALRWLLQKLRPDHKTIADFRKHNLKPGRAVCRTCTRLCKQLDRSDEQADRGAVGGAHAEALAVKIEALKQRKLCYEGFQAQLRASGQAQLSLTDPESRAMQRGTGRGTEGCYNVQTAVDAKHKRIVACEVTNDPGDRDWLSPMALQANPYSTATLMLWRTWGMTMGMR